MKILHLEDNASDADLIRAQCQSEWPDCEIDNVDNRDAFLQHLVAGGHDLILSDFNLVNFDGLEALRLAHKLVPDIPFIYFSGTIGEERALAALREGARDYVIKDRPKRLLTAIQRALDDTRIARERREESEQLQRIQRIENLGMLAAGIAHDFNNVLAPVLMGLPLLKTKLSQPNDRRLIENIESSVQRGAGLVRQILGFAHGVGGENQLLQAKHLLREILSLMEQTFPATIRIEHSIEPGLRLIKANPTQIHQIVLNLCVNARDAMPQGGTIRIAGRNVSLDANSRQAPNLPAGAYLEIEITDTGTGIPPEVLERIWEPFFTTKANGKGTGLGLATVRGIVTAHNGSISLETEPGKGTRFRVLLPAAQEAATGGSAARSGSVPEGSGELVLIVDDDPVIREVTAAAVSSHGYRTLTAADGIEALALASTRKQELRVLISDIEMPNLDGVALAGVVRSLNPTVVIILMSGANSSEIARRIPAECRFFTKPSSSETLLLAMSELLSGPINAIA